MDTRKICTVRHYDITYLICVTKPPSTLVTNLDLDELAGPHTSRDRNCQPITAVVHVSDFVSGFVRECRARQASDSFTLFIEGRLIDSWSDSRTKSGGVGFFCASGERARVAWVRVSHNVDATGRLCAFVSPLL